MESGMSCPCFNMRWAGQARGQIFVISKPKYWCIGWVDFGKGVERIKVMFGNSFCFLFSKTCFWKYKEKTIFLYF